MKKNLKRLLAAVCGTTIVFSATSSAAATTLKTEWPGVKIPTPKNYTWYALGEATGTRKDTNYFVIDTVAGTYTESLYVSFPKEGGFRIQSLHELQKKNGVTTPEKSNVGLFEPSALEKITYTTDGNAVKMTGTDGTVVKYTQSSTGFALTIYKENDDKIVSLTNKQFSFAYNRKGEVVRSMVEFPLADKEAIYGGGERYNGANQVGKTISLTNLDCWSLPEYSYINVPLFHSNRGYSVWFNMTYVGEADIGDTNKHKYSVKFDGSKLDLYLWQGMPLDNLKKYTALTGTSGVSETWTYGFWTGAQNAAFENTGLANSYANIMALINGYKEHYNFYPEACYAEGASARNAQVTNFLRRNNIKTLGWFSPDLWKNLGLGTINDILPAHSELPVFDATGKIIDSGQPFGYDSMFLKTYGKYRISSKNYVDFSNPSAVELITSCWQQYWDWGVAGTMDDFGEWYPFNVTYFNGLSGDEMHNLMSYYYAKACNEAWTAAKGNDYVLFQRSGCAGSQYYSGNFLGDNVSTYNGGSDPDNAKEDGYEHNGYNAVISAMISMGASGFNLYGADLGGLGGTPSNDLWNRWVSLSLFSPYMRQHGSVIHQPWNYGMLATQNFGNVYYLRKNLVPTIESAAIKAEKTSNPIIKGMMVAYPYQLSLANVENQYLFCDDFLVCPVTTENVYYQKVSLPKGSTWYELNTYKAYDGGQTFNAEAPTSDFPVYVKGGAVKAIDLPESMKLGAEMHDNSGDEFTNLPALLITPPDKDSTTVIYDKQGASTDYHTYNAKEETYVNAKTSNTVFTVTNKDGSARSIILALGVTAGGVEVDGKALDRLSAMPDYQAKQYGYYVDTDGLTTIYAPSGWKTLTVKKGSVKSASVELSGVGKDAEEMTAMFDGNVTTSFTLPRSTGAYTTIELAEKTKIDRVSIGWAVGFSNTYDIEYSTDGENWSVILPQDGDEHTVVNGGGSRDDVRFEAVDAKYLRVRTVQVGDAGTPAIYSFAAYAETEPSINEPSGDEPGNSDKWEDYDDNKYDEDVPWDDDNDDPEVINKTKHTVVTTTSLSPFGIALIVAGGILVLGGIALVIILIVKKKKKGQEAEPPAAD